MGLFPIHRLRGISLTAITLLGVLAVACSSQPETPTPRAPTPTLVPLRTISLTTATRVRLRGLGTASDFEATLYGDESGRVIRLSDLLEEGRPLVLILGATLQPVSRAQLPIFERIERDLGQRLTVFYLEIGSFVGLRRPGDSPGQLLASLAPSLKAGEATSASAVTDYRVLGVPTTALISPERELLVRWTGAITEAQLRDLIADHLGISG